MRLIPASPWIPRPNSSSLSANWNSGPLPVTNQSKYLQNEKRNPFKSKPTWNAAWRQTGSDRPNVLPGSFQFVDDQFQR